MHEFCIRGLHCTDCARSVEVALGDMEGVDDASVEMGSGRVCVTYQPGRTKRSDIESTVRRMGYAVSDLDTRYPEGSLLRTGEARATIVAGVLLALGILLEVTGQGPSLAELASLEVMPHHAVLLVSMLFGGAYILNRALRSLSKLTFTADGLMIVAAVGATAIGEMAEGAAVLFLYSLAELLEDYSSERNRRSLRGLAALAPRGVTVLRDGQEVEVGVEEVGEGEVAAVRPGERVPVDGQVASGATTVDEAAITGESRPVAKSVGDQVFAGTRNLDGFVRVTVSRPAHDTTLARIVQLVEGAEERRAPVERFIDRFARWYTPVILLLALLVATVPPLSMGLDWDAWFYRALMLLVIACPCALAISVPVAVVSAVSAAAGRGVLFKGGAHLEALSEVDVVAFDKTGTVTEGRLSLAAVTPVGDVPADDVLRLAAAVERGSEHHLAEALASAARARGLELPAVKGFRALPGKGVEGTLADTGQRLVVGNAEWLSELGLEVEEVGGDEGEALAVASVVHVARGEEVLGRLAFRDAPRPNSREALARLSGLRTVLLSGDTQEAAGSVASAVGIDDARGSLLPEEKLELIRELQAAGHRVAMVGDGVNDAPALAEADVGVAMGAAGSDVALETADVVLMRDDLSLIPESISLSRRAMAVVRQNIVAAIAIKVAVAALVFMGLATLWMAVAVGDMGASLLVILNALRLGRGVGLRGRAAAEDRNVARAEGTGSGA